MSSPIDEARTPPYHRLDPADNVVVVVRSLHKGTTLQLDGTDQALSRSFRLGDKIAATEIAMGDSVRRAGVVIGTATVDIAVGELVHSHNLVSNYLAGTEGHDRGRTS